ncbi:helix-turn-helix transcriptional regulator [Rhodomicrobium sp. Az07]|uniref:helix-turn-helix domain-containing protein n=1 Tax=Rhodomicrobium sp. Az07 TaxID=2839034 RepID=UPI001BEBD53D|nr:helix-turn-helix transcriptional regulator [Rhodomicrobium sp. Az07]MBT3072048.1 helix-turn-helix transcriptional regulator [Rhodomicrobium sp. Az07]
MDKLWIATKKDGKKPSMAVNRIRQLRLERGLSLTELAKKIGISESHLSRVEAGARGLHLSKMEALAGALGVPVTEILSVQSLSYMADLAPYIPPKGSAIEKALTSSTQKMFKVLSNVMSELGITEGDPIIADMNPKGLEKLELGQLVIAQVFTNNSVEGVLLLRQYIGPHLLITNSDDQNAMPIHRLRAKATVIGCVLL